VNDISEELGEVREAIRITLTQLQSAVADVPLWVAP
jgi:NTP pyrophosphatase (non-canonical NTP hydrolase)